MPGHSADSGRDLALARQLLSAISCERSDHCARRTPPSTAAGTR
jgi:hypothetical protein